MERWTDSVQSALRHHAVQAVLACALLVPLAATVGQYAASGFWRQSTAVGILYWPGEKWQWAISLPVWLGMGAMLASYVAGVAWLARTRRLALVVLSGVGAMIAAKLAAVPFNYLAGWRDLQAVSSLDLAGRVNQAIFALWHNPAWEEVVFRGIPLALLLLAARGRERPARWWLWCYLLLPSLAGAVYHVPGHGPGRLVDTFVLGLALAWMALRFTFVAPLVVHYVFDAVMTLSIDRVPGVRPDEVVWLSEHRALLNSTWSLMLLAWVASILVVVAWRRVRSVRSSIAVAPG